MPKVYILPEMNVTDRNINRTIMPNTADNYRKLGGYWSIFEYYMWNYATLELGASSEITTMVAAKPIYTFYLDDQPLKTPEQLRSFDVELGKHTLTLDLRLSVPEFYSKPDIYEHFAKKTTYKTYYSKKALDFNIESGDAFFVLSLKYDVYYPLLTGNAYVLGYIGYCPEGAKNCFFHKSSVKNIRNVSISFEQVDLPEMRARLSRHVKYTPYFIVARNEPLPVDEGIANHSVKSSTGNSSTVQTKPNAAQSVKVEQKTNNVNNLPNSNIQAQNLNNSSTIQANKKVEKPEIKTIVKEVEKRVPYYETKEFKDLMKDYDYEIVGTKVAIKKVVSAKKEMVIPDGVTLIKENAFGKDLSNVLSVTIPYSVTTIEKGAFLSNTYVQKVVLNANITTIKEDTFKGCTSLKDIIFSPTIEHIEKGAFSGVRVDNIFLPYGAKYDKDSFDKSVNVVYGNKKTLEIQKQVQKEIEKENSINVREEITAIKEQKFDRDEIIKRYDEEIAQIENSYESELEKYKAELERFDLTYLGKEKEVQSLMSDYDKVKDEISKNTALSIEYDRKFKKLLKDFAKAYDIDLKKKYPGRF